MTESVSRTFARLGLNVSNTGTLTTNAATASKWSTARTITLGGDLSGNVSIDGSESVTLTATVSGNSVALGTDTTGDYVASVTAGTGITVTGTGESAAVTVAIDNTVATLTGSQTLTNKTISGANNTLSNIANSSLSNSTISGIALGSNLADLTVGTGVSLNSGTTYNGGTAKTISIGQAVGTGDNVTFAGVTADAVRVGVTAAAEIDTTAGNLTIDSTGGTTVMDDDVNVTGNLQIDGNLVVSGTTVTMNATNLNVEDNMIYLNSGSAVANPDLGFAGNYNDGTYRHAGLFRDASDGVFKFFHQYVPEPDASAYIDITHGTFALAAVQASSFTGTLVGAAPAGSLSGSTLASGVTASSLTSVGTLTSLTVSGTSSLNGAVIINDAGADVDFRVESDTKTHMLFVDASADSVGIGVTNPAAYGNLAVAGAVNIISGGNLFLWDSGNTNAPGMSAVGDAIKWTNSAGTVEWMRINGTGLGIGVTPSARLDVGLSSATTYTSGATGNGLRLYNSSTTNNQYVGITFSGEPTAGNAGLATIYGITTSSGNMDLAFSTRASATLAERMRITATGDVYINVPTTGNAKLTVRGAGLTDSTYSLEAANSAGNTRFIVHDNGISRFFGSSGAETVRIDASGNLGVGVTPSAPIHVKSANNEIMRLQSSDTTTGALYFTFYDSADAEKGYIGYGASANDNFYIVNRKNAAMGFFTNGTERIWIDSSGNIGIGTTNPSGTGTNLEIKGVTNDATVKVTGNTAGNAYLQLSAGSSANAYINSVGSGYLAIGANGAASNAMTILSSGNVGIGTTSPTSPLEVSGTTGDVAYIRSTFATAATVGRILHLRDNKATTLVDSFISVGWTSSPGQDAYAGKRTTSNAGFFAIQNSSATELFTINLAAGNVGIGTTNPNGRLQFSNAAETRKIVLYEGANNNYQFYGFGVESSTLVYSTYTTSDDHVFFAGTGASTRNELMRIKGTGNVGIGITNPNAKLEVSGPAGTGGSTLLTLSKLSGWGTTDFFQYYTSATNYGINIGLGVSTATDGRAGITLRGNTITGDGAVIFNTNSTERMQITSLGEVAATHSTTKGPYIRAGNVVTLTNGSTLTLMSGVAGSALITIYETGSGNGGVFFASYSGTITKIAGEGEASDTGGSFAVYKSTNSHTVTLKNRYGISRDFAIGIFSSYAQ